MQWTKRTTILTLSIGLIIFVAVSIFMLRRTRSPRDRIIKRAMRSGSMTEGQAKIVAAISAHETGNWTSQLSKSPYNNGFGMHFPTKRETTAIGRDDSNWARFSSLESSVDDFLLWFKMYSKDFNTFTSVGEVITFMKSKGYFTDTYENYYNDVAKLYTQWQ